MNQPNKENLFNFSFDSFIENISSDDMLNPNPEISSSNSESSQYDKNPMEGISEMFKQNTSESEKRVNNKNITFKTEKGLLKKKRGRKTTRGNKKEIHTCLNFDNIISKVQIHFLSFLISFLNECILNFSSDKKVKFLNFAHFLKSNSTNKHINQIKNYTIKKLLEEWEISDKYKNKKKDNNKSILKKLVNDNPIFEKIFQKKYLEFFLLYFNNEEPLDELIINGNVIRLSGKTKSFYALLAKNENSKEYMLKYTKEVYPFKKGSFINKRDDFILNDIFDK